MKTKILNKLNKELEIIRQNGFIYSNLLNKSTDLKLHELAITEGVDAEDFEDFCAYHYELFAEYLKSLHLKQVYIGRSSSFYLNTDYIDLFKYSYQGKMTIKDIVYFICESSGIDTDYIEISETGLITDLLEVKFADGSYTSWEKYFLEDTELDIVISDLKSYVDDFVEDLNNIRSVYEYIENFKSNQIELFNEYQS